MTAPECVERSCSTVGAKQGRGWGISKYYRRYLEKLVGLLVPERARILECGCGTGSLLASLTPKDGVGIDTSEAMIEQARGDYPDLAFKVADAVTYDRQTDFQTVLMVNLIGLLEDIQAAFQNARQLLASDGRLVIVYYNHLWEPLLRFASALKLRAPIPPENWMPLAEIENLLELSGYQVVRSNRRLLMPVNIPIISWVINKWLAPLPLLNNLCLIEYVVARPRPLPSTDRPSCSIIIPTKDEKGNIRDAITRLPDMGCEVELIFVDGNSIDGTVEEIHAVMAENPDMDISFISQGDGRGKNDAVRKGFAAAKGDILMILDSDLTMPPEDLPKFYDALVSGEAEFANGCRLVYPMEKQAMRTLNKIANFLFGHIFAWLMEQRVRDTLCGTKVLRKTAYDKIAANRAFFGEFDPFGDFDLLFGAARLNMKIRDIPIRYRDRTYGDIKISRFRHGLILMRMTVFGAMKLKFL